jgi:hypothetical protein
MCYIHAPFILLSVMAVLLPCAATSLAGPLDSLSHNGLAARRTARQDGIVCQKPVVIDAQSERRKKAELERSNLIHLDKGKLAKQEDSLVQFFGSVPPDLPLLPFYIERA